MTDFGEKAWEDGFSDEIDYFDHLMNEASKTIRRDYEDSMVDELREEAAYLESQKFALALSNIDKIASDFGFTVLHHLGLKLKVSETNDPEVIRNLEFCKIRQGNILDIVYTSKDDIIKYNNIFNVEFSADKVCDDVYFIKHTNHYKMDIWVGSPIDGSDEKSFISSMMALGYVMKAIVTHVIDDYNYSYCLVQKNQLNPLLKPEFDDSAQLF